MSYVHIYISLQTNADANMHKLISKLPSLQYAYKYMHMQKYILFHVCNLYLFTNTNIYLKHNFELNTITQNLSVQNWQRYCKHTHWTQITPWTSQINGLIILIRKTLCRQHTDPAVHPACSCHYLLISNMCIGDYIICST